MFDTAFPPGLHHDWKSGFLEHIIIQQLHGHAARVSPDATAFPHRRSHYGWEMKVQPEHRPGGQGSESNAWIFWRSQGVLKRRRKTIVHQACQTNHPCEADR